MRLVILLFSLFCSSFSFGQISIEDFRLSGAAQEISETCIRLVPDVQYSSGSAWYKYPINLNEPFEMEICLMLGEKDEDGADGIVFVFYPQMMNTGFWGEGMGFAGLRPSLGIEFDTYTNYHLNDPIEDHLAIMTNGQISHYGNITEPVLLNNLEDGERHRMRILWNPLEQLLDVYLDDDLKSQLSGDLVGDLFRGNPSVYWGVTAATGRLSNNHEICIKKLLFTKVEDPKVNTAKGQ